VAGEAGNLKITEPIDLVAIRGILAARTTPAPAQPAAADAPSRVGIGFDAHRLVDGRPMRLAGVAFPDEPRGPEGHSDGDAALHAVIDALLGAAALGDIGTLFPSGDAQWEGVDSAVLVTGALERVRAGGWRPAAVDLTIVIARPAIAPRRDELVGRLAELLGIDPSGVSVKATTSDGLGFAGDEGVAAWAVATVEPIA
jgi:2-C-methyl-D-erythritol 2,4-cyclodiphosphate synthase